MTRLSRPVRAQTDGACACSRVPLTAHFFYNRGLPAIEGRKEVG